MDRYEFISAPAAEEIAVLKIFSEKTARRPDQLITLVMTPTVIGCFQKVYIYKNYNLIQNFLCLDFIDPAIACTPVQCPGQLIDIGEPLKKLMTMLNSIKETAIITPVINRLLLETLPEL